MTTPTFAAIVVALLDAAVGAVYSAKLIRKQIHPRIATWLIFEIGVLMSLVIYFSSRDHSVVKAALNLTDALVVTIILIALFFEQRTRGIRFTRNEQLCLAIATISVVAWMITRTAWVGFAGFQVVMTVAYAPTVESLWRWKPSRPPEPAATWATNAAAALLAVVIDLAGSHPDYVAMLYSLRALTLCVTVVILVERWKHKNNAARALHLEQR